MNEKFKISIANPCWQKWETLEPIAKDRGFCGSCQKELIDFTQYSDGEVLDFFKSSPSNICARLRTDQMRVYSDPTPKKRTSRWIAWPIAISALLFAGHGVIAQEQQRMELSTKEVRKDKYKRKGESRIVTGKVTDASGQPLTEVNVVIKGTIIGVQTDKEGFYQIEINSRRTVLVYSTVFQRTQETKVKKRSVIDIRMTEDTMQLGSVDLKRDSPNGLRLKTRGLIARIF